MQVLGFKKITELDDMDIFMNTPHATAQVELYHKYSQTNIVRVKRYIGRIPQSFDDFDNYKAAYKFIHKAITNK